MDDAQLLDEYRRDGSQAAFTALVGSHVDLVYSAARRQVADPGLAEDVTQAVFVLLATRAGSIRRPGALGGWLIKVTRYAAWEALRDRGRRQYHEQQAAAMRDERVETGAEPAWETYAPVVDEGMSRLGEVERSAVTLRYLQGLSLRQVGEAMGLSEEAARKRVDRGIAKLRGLVAKKVAAPSVAGLAAAMAANGVQAVPAGLAEAAVAASVVGGAAGTAGVIAKGAMKMMLWAKIKVAVMVLIGVAVLGVASAVTLHMVAAAGVGETVNEMPRYTALGDGWTHIRREHTYTPERRQEISGEIILTTTTHFDATSGTLIYDTQLEDGNRKVAFYSPGQRQRRTYDAKTNQLSVSDLADTAQEIRDRVVKNWSTDWATEKIRKVIVTRSREGKLDRYQYQVTMEDPDMNPGPTTVWVNPETSQLVKGITSYRGQTSTTTFSHGDPQFRDIYDLGVPRDATVLMLAAHPTSQPQK